MQKTDEMPWCPKLRTGTNGIWYPAIGQIKIDGEFQHIQYRKGEINTVNKYGLKRFGFPALDDIAAQIKRSHTGDITLLAELYWEEGKKGDLYKLLANKKSHNLKLYVHDILMQHTRTLERMSILKDMGFAENYVLLTNDADTKEYYDIAINSGYEGIVLKPVLAQLSMANRWVKMKDSDETEMMVVDLCEGQERVELEYLTEEDKPHRIGAKCPLFIKKTLKIGQLVNVKHYGFLSGGGVRNPNIIVEES